jgi:hypothetical protein
VRDVIRLLLPAPFLRAWLAGARRKDSVNNGADTRRIDVVVQNYRKANVPEAFLEDVQFQMLRQIPPEAMRLSAIRQLRKRLQPRVPDKGDHQMPLSECDTEDDRCLAIDNLANCTHDLDAFANDPVRPYISDFDNATIVIGIDRSIQPAEVTFAFHNVRRDGLTEVTSCTMPLYPKRSGPPN